MNYNELYQSAKEADALANVTSAMSGVLIELLFIKDLVQSYETLEAAKSAFQELMISMASEVGLKFDEYEPPSGQNDILSQLT